MNEENQLLVTYEPVEVEKKESVQIQDFRRFNSMFQRIYKVFFYYIKKTRKMSTCNRLVVKKARISTDHHVFPGY